MAADPEIMGPSLVKGDWVTETGPAYAVLDGMSEDEYEMSTYADCSAGVLRAYYTIVCDSSYVLDPEGTVYESCDSSVGCAPAVYNALPDLWPSSVEHLCTGVLTFAY